MKFYHNIIITTSFLFFFLTITQAGESRLGLPAQQYLDEKNEVYFSFHRPDDLLFKLVLNTVSVDKISEDIVFAYANKQEFKLFLELEIPYEVLPHPGDVNFDLNMKDWAQLKNRDLTESWDFYPTYEAYVALMYQFEADFPDLVEIIKIGESVMGRDLLFARISPQVNVQKPVPQFMYSSTMHGNETTGFVLSLRLIHHLITNYGEDEDITELMNSVDIWIYPNENPDGTYTNNNSTISGATRVNANGVDLNRNYPNPVNDPPQSQQPETTAMINFADTINFIMSANMHGGIELVNFPFDSWTSSVNTHADHDWWEFVMYEYVDTVHVYSPSGYMTGMGDGVTHGGDWYVVYGSRQDYFNYYRSCREFTLEISDDYVLNPALLPSRWEYNYRSLLNYIRQSTYGLHGLVYDNETGVPLQAMIYLPGHDSDNSEIVTSAPFGNYNRPLFPGQYNVTVSADQYASLAFQDVEINYYQTTYLNVALGDGVTNDIAEVSFDVEGMGHVDRFGGVQLFNDGANVFLNAIPDEGWMFTEWLINGNSYSDQELTYTLNGDTEIIALFEVMPGEPAIALDQYNLDFGMRLTGIVHTKNLTVKNTGNALLVVHLELEGDDAFFFEEPVTKNPYHIDPGSDVVVPFYFLPQDEDDYVAQLVLNSNDPDTYVINIPVTGTGINEAAIIQLSERVIDFGNVHIGQSSDMEFYVYNDGNLSFTLEDISLDGDVFMIEGEFPVTIDPGEQVVFTASFYPIEAGDYEQVAIIASDAHNEDETELMLTGTGVDPTNVDFIRYADGNMNVFPNPLNGNSLLSMSINQAEIVDIAVFNLHGQMLERVFAGHLPPGDHSFSLSSAYNQMTTGVYILVVRAGTTVMTERMIRL
jgi:hypothetical protein